MPLNGGETEQQDVPDEQLDAYRGTSHLNESVAFGCVAGSVQIGEWVLDCELELTFDWCPYPRHVARTVVLDAPVEVARFLFRSNVSKVGVRIRGTLLEAMLLSHEDQLEGNSLRLSLELLLPDSDFGSGPMRRVRFCLSNLDQYYGEVVRRTPDSFDRAGLTFCQRGWRVVVQGVSNLAALSDQRKTNQGHAITHRGYFERTDGSPIDVSDAEQILSVLLHMLCLVHGAWTPYLFPEGLDSEGTVVWERWYTPKGDHWSSPRNWFSTQDVEGLDSMFGHILRAWENPSWVKTFQNALYLYELVSANRTPDATLIMTQTGLEILSWYRFVVAGKEDPKQFDGERASNRVRRLLDDMGVQFEIPSQLSSLQTYAQEEGWNDGPRAITELRNYEVHPRKMEEREVPWEVIRDGSSLALWYFELGLLEMAGYKAIYRNRIRRHEPRPLEWVPWR